MREQQEERHHVGNRGPGDKPEKRNGEGAPLAPLYKQVVAGKRDGDGIGVSLEGLVAVALEGRKVQEEKREQDDRSDGFPFQELRELEEQEQLEREIHEEQHVHSDNHVRIVERNACQIVDNVHQAEGENALDAETVVACGEERAREVPEDLAVEFPVEPRAVVNRDGLPEYGNSNEDQKGYRQEGEGRLCCEVLFRGFFHDY